MSKQSETMAPDGIGVTVTGIIAIVSSIIGISTLLTFLTGVLTQMWFPIVRHKIQPVQKKPLRPHSDVARILRLEDQIHNLKEEFPCAGCGHPAKVHGPLGYVAGFACCDPSGNCKCANYTTDSMAWHSS